MKRLINAKAMWLAAALIPLGYSLLAVQAQEVDPAVLEAQEKRIQAIEKVRPAVVAIFAKQGQGGGSGVLISKDGYALTNFHVVKPAGNIMKAGLADGVLYDAVVVGIDPVGDVALIKLFAKQKVKTPDGKEVDKDFPFAVMGDSDKVKPGDWSLAMGNPFLLATDFTPTVTYGLVSGTHRYQYPEGGGLLEYTDCIQIDTSINPGNSGGPLFNLDGEIIGINGRGSFEKRGRVNSGVGYAISINQIKNFLGHLRAGLIADHATLGAQATPDEDGTGAVISNILENSDVSRRGIHSDDRLLAFAGRPVGTVNQFKNVLGIYPRGWRVPIEYRQYDSDENRWYRRETLVRLMGSMKRELEGDPKSLGLSALADPTESVLATTPSASFEAKKGYANYYFNKVERNRLWAAQQAKHGDFSKLSGNWTCTGKEERPTIRDVEFALTENLASLTWTDAKGKKETVSVEPDNPNKQEAKQLREPAGSGGLLMGLYHWRRLLQQGEKGFKNYVYAGYEPFYPNGTVKSRVEAEVLETEYLDTSCKFYFGRDEASVPAEQRGMLLGLECYLDKERSEDPCEITFLDYRPVKELENRKLPHKIEVRHGSDKRGQFREYAIYLLKDGAYTMAAKENPK